MYFRVRGPRGAISVATEIGEDCDREYSQIWNFYADALSERKAQVSVSRPLVAFLSLSSRWIRDTF